LATSLISIVAALGGHRTSDLIDISAALVGAAVAFGFFAARLHVFSSHAAGDELADDLHSVDME
jgi:hypothetical protein